ncbi:neocarzinostatin apoprotein domain-containing protein [Corynebacterium sp. P5875]|uniref:Neocarzinostatin apoprotein domain-containing protein n=1 Tax=Corynebacterium antarcticum TaxID=2800405 RepID=A0A9Q4GLB3_9CORY|nr:neocarzinostatin apoprotein domain-containing protein [Corynebacterium antarcticum]MCX7537593.1 neocarzinostatin apoprotein domain-containing protein [Corynebacterium antarcticum]
MSRLFTARTAAFAAASLILIAPLAACSNSETESTTDPSEVDASISEMSESVSEGIAEMQSELSPTTSSTATAAPDVKITVDKAEGIKAGDTLTVEVTGLNPEAGYYSAICAAQTPGGAPVPVCTGEMGDVESQAWLQNERGTAKIAEDGTASFTLTANPTGEGIDCTTDECVLKVFGDHSEGFKDVAEVPVTFAS